MSRSAPVLSNRYFGNQSEHLHIWAQIFIDGNWLEKQISSGLVPALIGWDIQFITSATVSSEKPLIALVLAGPRQDMYNESLESFRNELCPHDFNDHLGQIQFPNFDLAINHILNGPGIHNMAEPASLLQPDYFVIPNKAKTLVTYYGQSPSLIDAIYVDHWMLLINDNERKFVLLFVADQDELRI